MIHTEAVDLIGCSKQQTIIVPEFSFNFGNRFINGA